MPTIKIRPIKPIPHLRGRHLGGRSFIGGDGEKFLVEVSANPKSGWRGISIECHSDGEPVKALYLHPDEAVALKECLAAAIETAASNATEKAA